MCWFEACNIAAAQVMSGQSDPTIGGGVGQCQSSNGQRRSWMTTPSVAFKTYFVPQGISADLLASKYNYSRDDVDLYAVNSQKKANEAWEKNILKIV